MADGLGKEADETLGQGRIIEECFSTLLFLCVLFLSVAGTAARWKEEAELRCAEHIVLEFLNEASAHGYVTAEEYAKLQEGLWMIDSSYQAECRQIIYLLSPVYEYQDEWELEQYYAKRNIRKPMAIEEVLAKEEKEQGNFQDFDNAVLLAGSGGTLFVPLPGEEDEEVIEAVVPVQKVYLGEALVTLCRVKKGGSIQYAEAEPITLSVPGTHRTELRLQGKHTGVFLDVTVYQRSIVCDAGHSYANTKERIEYYEQMGAFEECPYCAEIPERLEFPETVIYKAIGTSLLEAGFFAHAFYSDGREETVLPGCDGWQDDYDAGYYGMQLVTVCYKGRTDYLTVVTEGGRCPNCGSECRNRCYTDYKIQPLCNKCLKEMPVYTGTTAVSEYIAGKEVFIEAWETEGCYFLQQNGSLQVAVSSPSRSVLIKEKMIQSGAGE